MQNRFSWGLQILIALILGQTLFFKFGGAPESIYIFETLGVEPWGRYAAATIESIAVVLLLLPRWNVFGAFLAGCSMIGAIAAHLGKLGIVVADDGGLLFGLALVVLFCSALLLFLRRRLVMDLLGRLPNP